MQKDHRTIWEHYVASWKAPSVAEKQALYEKALSRDCVYTDPLRQAKGFDEILAYMQEFHRNVPGGHFVTTQFFTHHDRSVATWDMRSGDDETLGVGISYAEYRSDGKLTAMSGFFEVSADADAP